jgi:hypothetical protein
MAVGGRALLHEVINLADVGEGGWTSPLPCSVCCWSSVTNHPPSALQHLELEGPGHAAVHHGRLEYLKLDFIRAVQRKAGNPHTSALY